MNLGFMFFVVLLVKSENVGNEDKKNIALLAQQGTVESFFPIL